MRNPFNPRVCADRIRALRRRTRLSKIKFAAAIGTSGVLVNKWEQGDISPTGFYLCAMSKAFGVSVDWLLGLTDERRKHGDT